jgi:hypothetical protein
MYRFLTVLLVISVTCVGCGLQGPRLSPMPMNEDQAQALIGGDPTKTLWCSGQGRAKTCTVISTIEANRRARNIMGGYE